MRRILVGCAVCAVLLGTAPSARSQALPGPGSYLKQEPVPGRLNYGVVVYVDDGTCPSGEIKEVTGGNNTLGINRKKQCIALSASALAAAQEAPKFLSKQEIESTLGGKVLLFTVPRDGRRIQWDVRNSGFVHAQTIGNQYGGGRMSGWTGPWEVREDGAMCIKWPDLSTDCNYFFWVGDRLKFTSEPTAEAAASRAVTLELEK